MLISNACAQTQQREEAEIAPVQLSPVRTPQSAVRGPCEGRREYESVFANRSNRENRLERPFAFPRRYGTLGGKRPRPHGMTSAIVTPPSHRACRNDELVDLTGEDEESIPNAASHTPSRLDLLAVTGSSSTGVDSSDLSPAVEPIELEDDGARPIILMVVAC